jgi:hypothetical protein
MLVKIKLVISTLVLLVAACIAFYDYRIGLYPPAAVALGVGMFVVFCHLGISGRQTQRQRQT